jgi:hypothetical protein
MLDFCTIRCKGVVILPTLLEKNRDTITRCVCFWLAATDCLIALVTLHMYGASIS